MMTPREFVEAHFRTNPAARKIEQAMQAADDDDERTAWAIVNPLGATLGARDRHELSDQIYSRLAAAKTRRAEAQKKA